MTRFLHLAVPLSTATISSLLFLGTAEVTRSYPICYMINSSGQLVNLDYLCGKKIEETANICQEPVNRRGLPLSVARDLKRHKENVRKVLEGVSDADTGPEYEAMIDRLAFPARIQDLIQKQKFLLQQRKQALKQYNIPLNLAILRVYLVAVLLAYALA
jgi:hypothetical protein